MTESAPQTYVCQKCRKRRLAVYRGPDEQLLLSYRGGRLRGVVDSYRKAEGEDWRIITPPHVEPLGYPVAMTREHGEVWQMSEAADTVALRACNCPAAAKAMPTQLVRDLFAAGRRVVNVPHNGVLPS